MSAMPSWPQPTPAILAAETAVQVHGAMGYTYEVDLHFWIQAQLGAGGGLG